MNTPDLATTLFCQKGTADKEYRVTLTAVDGGFVVNGYNGRRGSALKCQPKTPSPVTYAAAEAIFNDLVKSKIKGGYSPAAQPGDTFSAIADMGEPSGIDLQLLLAHGEADIERFLTDDAYLAQTKEDGERRPVCIDAAGKVFGSNRSSLKTPLPNGVVDALRRFPHGTTIDGEIVGDQLIAFDLLQLAGNDWYQVPCRDRLDALAALTTEFGGAFLRLVEWADGTQAKRALYERLRASKAEGIVFKRKSAGLAVGRNEDQVKIKFVERATVRVASVHPTKRSIGVEVMDAWCCPHPIGNVTIPANHAIPAVGEIVEVEYLYVVSSLYQPVYLGPRTDLGFDACTIAQLKYKAGAATPGAVASPPVCNTAQRAANDVQHTLFA